MTEDVMKARDVYIDAGVIISNAVKWSAAAGVIPIPYVDLVALGAVQFTMVRDLCSLYHVEADTKIVQTLVTTTFGSLAPTVVSTGLVGSSLKLIPEAAHFLVRQVSRRLVLLPPMLLVKFLSVILKTAERSKTSALKVSKTN